MIPKRYYIKNFPVSYVISYIDFTSRDIPEKKLKSYKTNETFQIIKLLRLLRYKIKIIIIIIIILAPADKTINTLIKQLTDAAYNTIFASNRWKYKGPRTPFGIPVYEIGMMTESKYVFARARRDKNKASGEIPWRSLERFIGLIGSRNKRESVHEPRCN